MELWGFEIFDDDIALDVKSAFEEYIDSGMSTLEATEQIMHEYEDALSDSDQRWSIILALAILQLREDDVQDDTRDMALDIIENGEFLDSWEYLDEEDLKERKKILKTLRAKLIH